MPGTLQAVLVAALAIPGLSTHGLSSNRLGVGALPPSTVSSAFSECLRSFWCWPCQVIVMPILLGRIFGRAAYLRKDWVLPLTGPSPAPRAWDDLFASPDLNGWLILRMKDATWLGGLWGRSDQTGLTSYAAGYPEIQDLLIADLAEMDPAGELLVDAGGRPVLIGVSLLVRWEEVAYAKFIPG